MLPRGFGPAREDPQAATVVHSPAEDLTGADEPRTRARLAAKEPAQERPDVSHDAHRRGEMTDNRSALENPPEAFRLQPARPACSSLTKRKCEMLATRKPAASTMRAIS